MVVDPNASEELRTSRMRLVVAEAALRERLERQLDERLQQRLALLRLRVELARHAAGDRPDAAKALDGAALDIDALIAELRDLAYDIYPRALTHGGLVDALEESAERSSIATTITAEGIGRYPAALEAAIYRACAEALERAGEGGRATIQLVQSRGQLRFEVETVGPASEGPDPRLFQEAADRIVALDGELSVESGAAAGTRVIGRLPAEPVS
jgi:signal transduction histidine kinase